MTRITLDQSSISRLLGTFGDVEICDENGNPIGRFSPNEKFVLSQIPSLTDEEVREALKQPTKTTAEVLRDLEKLK